MRVDGGRVICQVGVVRSELSSYVHRVFVTTSPTGAHPHPHNTIYNVSNRQKYI